MQEPNDTLNFKVNFQENIWTNVSAFEPTIKNLLDEIQFEKYKHQVTDYKNQPLQR